MLSEDTGLEEPGNWPEDLEEEQPSRCGQIQAHVPHIQHVKASGDRHSNPPDATAEWKGWPCETHPSASWGLPSGPHVTGGESDGC